MKYLHWKISAVVKLYYLTYVILVFTTSYIYIVYAYECKCTCIYELNLLFTDNRKHWDLNKVNITLLGEEQNSEGSKSWHPCKPSSSWFAGNILLKIIFGLFRVQIIIFLSTGSCK